MSRKVYLAGPVTGLSFDAAERWRGDMSDALAAHGIDAYSPLRGQETLRLSPRLGDGYNDYMANDRAVMARDFFDCQTADVIVANLLGAIRVSIGTCMEIGWAHALRKPLVVVMEPEGNPHDHCLVREAAGWRVPSVQHALDVVISALTPVALPPALGYAGRRR